MFLLCLLKVILPTILCLLLSHLCTSMYICLVGSPSVLHHCWINIFCVYLLLACCICIAFVPLLICAVINIQSGKYIGFKNWTLYFYQFIGFSVQSKLTSFISTNDIFIKNNFLIV